MYLKKLEMRGFKSFADKTTIDFDNGVTCIVGPNGSGKSNITDGVRWVLGEQRAKTLRGSKMEDVIFNGTGHRKKLGMAEVVLTFDNSERYFELDYNEVHVCRRVYRSGESEYLINDTPCRLKDVKDLFMDTGIGTDGYSIIGQGRIESVLSNNVDERRLLFEEAAGIVKYKTRKRETERKLDNTEQNLIRIEDIYLELSKRVEPLRIESEKAKEHMTLMDSLSELEMHVFVNEIETIDKKIAKEDQNIGEVQSELLEKNSKKEGLEAQKSSLTGDIEGLQAKHKALENSFYEEKNSLANLDGDLHVNQVKLENNQKEKERLKFLVEDHQEKLKELKKDIENYSHKKDVLVEALETLNHNINAHEASHEQMSKELYDVKEANEGMRQQMLSKMNDISKLKSEISSYESILQNHMNRQASIDEELLEIKTNHKTSLEALHAIEQALKGLLEQEKSLEKSLLDYDKKEATLEKDIKSLQEIKSEDEKKLTEAKTEMNLLIQMEKEHAGYDHSVKKALQLADQQAHLKEGISGVVASLMHIPKAYEVALEVALGKSIQNIVVETPEGAKLMIDALKRTQSGRVTFIPLSSIESKGDQNDQLQALKQIKGYIGKANHLFDYGDKYNVLYDYLVGRTIVVDTVETATEALKIPRLKYKIVTLEGDVFIPGGTITGGSYKSRSSGLLSRKRKINELDELSKTLKASLVNQDEKIKTYSSEILDVKQKKNDFGKSFEEIRLQRLKKENDLALTQGVVKQKDELIARRQSELDMIKKDVVSVTDRINSRQNQIEALKEAVESFEEKITSDDTAVHDLQDKILEVREQLTDLKVNKGSKMETLKSVSETLSRLKSERENLLSVIESSQDQQKVSDDLILNIETEIKRIIEKKNKILEASVGQEEILNKILKDIENHGREIKKINQDQAEISDYVESLKGTLHRFEIKRAKYDVHRDDIAARLYERYEMTPEDALAIKKDIDLSSATKEIASIKKSLKEIGDVNIHAIEEYEEVYERYHFLKTQHDDLKDARQGLRKLIRALEKEMKEKFMTCFLEVKENFSEIFSNLFVGGVAELEIADMENILESDIAINVQPPGKKLQNLGLLSGGEKALTAIALLFAILKTKPAPFCILDEIEAALDDVNVYRFADFLKEFTQNSQFVIITHRKGTMEIADHLFGVTMAEFGISKMISVKLEDAILE